MKDLPDLGNYLHNVNYGRETCSLRLTSLPRQGDLATVGGIIAWAEACSQLQIVGVILSLLLRDCHAMIGNSRTVSPFCMLSCFLSGCFIKATRDKN